MHLKLFVFACFASVVLARTTSTNQNSIPNEEARSGDGVTSYMGDIRFLYRTYQECSATDLSSCLKLKLVTALDRASRAYSDVQLVEGVTLVKDASTPVDTTPVKSESELEATLPRSLNDKEDTLNGLILEKIANFFSTHTLQVKLPNAEDLQRSLTEEGRGKRKKIAPFVIMSLMIAGTLIPLAFGALALLAGKALIVSKLALVLASIIGLKKLVSGGGHESSHEVVVSSGHGGSGWGRNYQDPAAAAAQTKAYSAYAPKSS